MCEDYEPYSDDLLEWETNQVFHDQMLEREQESIDDFNELMQEMAGRIHKENPSLCYEECLELAREEYDDGLVDDDMNELDLRD